MVYNPVEARYPGNQPMQKSTPDTTLPPEAFAASASGAYPFPVASKTPVPKDREVVAPKVNRISAPKEPPQDMTFSPSAVSPYADLQRIDETRPVSTVRKQEEVRAGQLDQMLEDIQRKLGVGAINKNSEIKAQNTLSQSQYAAWKAEKDNLDKTIQFYNQLDTKQYLLANPTMLIRASADPLGVKDIIVNDMAPPQGVSKLSQGDDNPGAAAAPRPIVARNLYDAAPVAPEPDTNAPYEDAEMASVRRSAEAAPKVSARVDPANSAPYRGPMTARDPLTRKEYAPISQKDDNSGIFSRLFNNKDEQNRLTNYQSDSSLRRSGPMGEESPTDFIMNQPIYKKRMEEQPPMEARGGPIRGGGNAHDDKCHVGIIHMAVGGRTDHLPMNVYANSYVLPADVVSGLGEGNTLAGGKVIDQMFSGDALHKMASKTVKDPLKREDGGNIPEKRDQMMGGIVMPPNINIAGIDMTGGPMGSKIIPIRGSSSNFGPKPYEYRWQPDKLSAVKAATGGMINDRSLQPIEIVAAGGEYVIPPEVVRKLGHGNADAGHKWLDNFVKSTRAHVIKTMQNLPGPKKD